MTTRYVDPNSTGGDGTTNELTGGTAAYASLNAALTALAGTLTEPLVIVCGCNGGSYVADTTAATVTGFTTTEANYLEIKTDAASKASASWSSTKYRLEVSDGVCLLINDDWVRVTGLQIKVSSTTGDGRNGISITTVGTASFYLSGNFIHCARTSGTNVRGINIADSTATVYAWNNIVYGTGTPTVGIRYYNQSASYGYNNTIVGFTNGMEAPTTGTVQVINNLFSGNTNASTGAGAFAAGSGYNATNLATLNYTVTGGSTGDRLDQTFSFEGAADFHLTANDAGARNYGLTNPGSGLFTDDIDGTTRSAPWDIGADEVPGDADALAAGAGENQLGASVLT